MEEYLTSRSGSITWRIRADAAGWLLEDGQLDVDRLLARGRHEVVKHGPHRTVYRLVLPDRVLFVKRFRVPDMRAAVSQWLQWSRARREWRRLLELNEQGFPTVRPVALGEQRPAGAVWESYLITESLEGTEPLDQFIERRLPELPPRQRSRLRCLLATKAATLIAELHNAGFMHQDLHAGNVLVRYQPGAEPELYLIDLHSVRLTVGRRPLGWYCSRQNLLDFGRFFLSAGGRIDRARFLKAYLERRPSLGLQWRAVARSLERQLLSSARRFWRRRDFRCVGINRRFRYRNRRSAHGFSVTELPESVFERLLADPDRPFRMPEATVLKDSYSSNVVKLELPVGGRIVPVICKRFNCCKRLDAVRATLHHSPALRAWHAGHGLLNRGVPTARPLAVIERIRWPVVTESYLLTEYAEGAVELGQFLSEQLLQYPERQRRRIVRDMATQLGLLVRRMHERNISHRDMKVVNFLATPQRRPGDTPQVMLIDLAGVQIWRRLPGRRMRQNLARMAVSFATMPTVTRTDMLRFLRAYLPNGLKDRRKWKSLWHTLQREAERKIARNIARQRVIS